MKFASVLVALAALLSHVAAAPTPADVAPRCGTTYYPTILQQLVEDSPNTVSPNTVGTTGDFHVQRVVNPDGTWSSRVYQLVGFEGIAPGSYGCQLALTFPPGYAGVTTTPPGPPGPQLNVTTVLDGDPAAVAYPNSFSWSSLGASGALLPGQGLFGTVSAVPGTTAVINSETCAGALAFLFEIAAWTSETASVDFVQQSNPLAGVYLTANC